MTLTATGATTKLAQAEMIPQKTDVGALANRINAETQSLHNKLNKLMMLKFALALRDYKIYRQGLQSFYHVFRTVEECLFQELNDDSSEWKDTLTKVWKPEMARTERAQTDLLFYYDDDKSKFSSPIMPAQIEFANHIRSEVQKKPYLLLAYLHVMYLALFAGGKILRSSVSRATGLYPKKDGLKHEDIIHLGTNFFEFDVADEDTFRLLYKRDYELATRNHLTEEQKLDILEESKYIFEQNGKCISELEAHNMARIKSKWMYMLVSQGHYAVMVIMALVVILALRRIFVTLF